MFHEPNYNNKNLTFKVVLVVKLGNKNLDFKYSYDIYEGKKCLENKLKVINYSHPSILFTDIIKIFCSTHVFLNWSFSWQQLGIDC